MKNLNNLKKVVWTNHKKVSHLFCLLHDKCQRELPCLTETFVAYMKTSLGPYMVCFSKRFLYPLMQAVNKEKRKGETLFFTLLIVDIGDSGVAKPGPTRAWARASTSVLIFFVTNWLT